MALGQARQSNWPVGIRSKFGCTRSKRAGKSCEQSGNTFVGMVETEKGASSPGQWPQVSWKCKIPKRKSYKPNREVFTSLIWEWWVKDRNKSSVQPSNKGWLLEVEIKWNKVQSINFIRRNLSGTVSATCSYCEFSWIWGDHLNKKIKFDFINRVAWKLTLRALALRQSEIWHSIHNYRSHASIYFMFHTKYRDIKSSCFFLKHLIYCLLIT